LNLLTQGRLPNMQSISRAGKGEFFSNRYKVPQVAQLHRLIS
jgi:hypothetical protein